MTSLRDRTDLQSSEYWQELVKDDFIVYDPDGWDRKNYLEWLVEVIEETTGEDNAT